MGTILIGAGGHSKLLVEIIAYNNKKIDAIVAKDEFDWFPDLDIQKFRKDEKVLEFDKEEFNLVNGIGHLPKSKIRENIFNFFKNEGYEFETLIHRSAIISETAIISEGAQVFPGAILNPNSKIGENTIVNSNVLVEHDCLIGKSVHLAPSCTLCGNVKIGEGSFVGAGSVVAQGAVVPKNSFIKAGEVVC